jgi:hypothetical protein
MDNLNMKWETEFGECIITRASINWIMENVKESMYNKERCYVYNKAFARWFVNNDPYAHITLTGALSPTGVQNKPKDEDCDCDPFDLIRDWARERGLYKHGDTKTQALKLVEEVGEICRAILKDNHSEIKDRTGKMDNGTFKKD